MSTRVGDEPTVLAAGVGALCVALGTAGCGGGAPLSKSALDAKANSICARYTKKIDAVPTPRRIDEVPAYVVIVKPYLERGVDALASLKPPPDLKALYGSWMSTQRQALTQTDELRQAAERNDVVGVNRMVQVLRSSASHGHSLAAKLGAGVCARA